MGRIERSDGECPECGASEGFRLCPFMGKDPRDPMSVEKYKCQACEEISDDWQIFEEIRPPQPP